MKELNAIIEYENARLSVLTAKELIAGAMGLPCLNPIETDALSDDKCISELYEYNRYVRIFDECEGKMYEGEFEQDMKPAGDAPELCANCKKLDEQIQFRKLCKKRYGIAKRRISALARPHIIRAD
jgi:hypothetical protein